MISSIGNNTALSQLFSRLDSKGQGYLEKSDFASAFSAIGDDDESSVADVFAALDSDSDGKVTESEFSSTLSKLQKELDSQFEQMRMQGMMAGHGPQGMAGGMPPPPPPADDEGFTQDELEAQLTGIEDTDSERASLISSIVSNFEAADTDGDGKVSFQEAMAYKESQSQDATGAASAGTAGAAATNAPQQADSEARIMQRILQLVQAYGYAGDSAANPLLSTQA